MAVKIDCFIHLLWTIVSLVEVGGFRSGQIARLLSCWCAIVDKSLEGDDKCQTDFAM